jgi:hypothetical protein
MCIVRFQAAQGNETDSECLGCRTSWTANYPARQNKSMNPAEQPLAVVSWRLDPQHRIGDICHPFQPLEHAD